MNLLEQYKDFKSGYVAIIGRPNAGKSTLLNRLLDIKLSIVSYRPQTTRKRVLGILNEDKLQTIFFDTPGMIKPEYEMHKHLMEYVHKSTKEADMVMAMFAVDKFKGDGRDFKQELDYIKEIKIPVVAVINKIDQVKKADILPMIEYLGNQDCFKSIVPISALKDEGITELKEEFKSYLPFHPPYYDQEVLTEQPERFFASEIVRETIFLKYRDEIPYSTEVTIEEFKERPNGKTYIRANINVERESQKKILVGKGASALKDVGQRARKQLEKFLDRPVYLELFVKVNPNWRNDKNKLKWMGY